MFVNAILLAGGLSKRMGVEFSKVFYEHNGKAIVRYSFDLLAKSNQIKNIIVVCPKTMQHYFPKSTVFAPPGQERFLSVENGLKKIENDLPFALVHDGARPLLTLKDVNNLIEIGCNSDGAALAGRVKNSLMRVSSTNAVKAIIPRDNIWETYTPQIGKVTHLLEAISKAKKLRVTPTDEMTLLHGLGLSPKLVEASFPNIKITYPQDLPLVLDFLDKLHEGSA